MGVDTKLFISDRWTVQDIREVITKRFEVRTKLNFHEFAPQYYTILFTIPNGNERMLHVHTDSMVGGLKAISLGFRSNDESHMILKTLAETFGGLFQPNDTSEDLEAFQPKSEGFIDFIVNEAIKTNPELGRDSKAMCEYLSQEKWK